MQNDHLKFIRQHRIPGELLREFVSKELWSAVCDSCDIEIAQCEEWLRRLKELKNNILEERENED